VLLLLVEKETVKKDNIDWRSRIELQLEDCCRTNKPARHTSNHLANARAHLLNINMIADQGFINMMVHQSSFINMASFEKRGQQVEFQQPQALEGKGQEWIFGEASKDLQWFIAIKKATHGTLTLSISDGQQQQQPST